MNKLFIVTDVPPQRVSGINIAENVRNKLESDEGKTNLRYSAPHISRCGYNSSAEAFSAFELYIKRLEGENLFDQKYIADWERIRRRFLNDPGKNIYVKGEECRKCVWSNTESGKILCTKSCRKKGGKI